MREIKYTEEQIKELLSNKYVKSCTAKNISFTRECKIKALELEKELVFRREIFRELGFPEYVYNSEIPTKSIDRWKRNINTKGIIEENKGRKKKERFDKSKMTKDEYIEYLETENAVLKELKKMLDGSYP